MGNNFGKKAHDVKDGAVEVAHEVPHQLVQKDLGGSVTVGYDPSNSNNTEQSSDNNRKPLNQKLHNLIANKYPDESVTMGDPRAIADADSQEKDSSKSS